MYDVDARRPAVTFNKPLQQREEVQVSGGLEKKRVGLTFMSSATLEPSTEYTQAAPAMREKKDRMPRLSISSFQT